MPRDWPANAKIRSARLRVALASYGKQSDVDLSGRYGARLSEYWAGEIELAAMSRDQAREIEAFSASLRGRLNPFLLPAAAGFLNQAGASATGTLISSAPYSSEIEVSLSGAAILPAGTLLEIGSPTVAKFQTVEVLDDVYTTGGATTVQVAPRIRHTFTPGVIVTSESVRFRLRYQTDASGFIDYTYKTGIVVLPVVEAIGAAGIATSED